MLRLLLALLAVTALAVPGAAHAESVTLSAPSDGAHVGAGVPVSFEGTRDGIGVVAIQVDGAPLCVLSLVPFRCTWTPTAADIGTRTVTAQVVALGAAGATLATHTQTLTVGRLLPQHVRATTVRARRGRATRLTTSGEVVLPAGLTAAQACAGTVDVAIRRGKRTVADRTATVGPDCRFSTSVSVRLPRSAKRLRVTAGFAGAPLLAPRAAAARTVRLR